MIKHLYKFFPYLEFVLWVNLFYLYFFGGFLAEVLPALSLIALYFIFPVFIFGSRSWQANLVAHLAGAIFAFGFYAVFMRYYEYANQIGPLVFWAAGLLFAFSFVKTFRSQEAKFYAQITLRLAMVVILCTPYILHWWV